MWLYFCNIDFHEIIKKIIVGGLNNFLAVHVLCWRSVGWGSDGWGGGDGPG